jgi:lysozyme
VIPQQHRRKAAWFGICLTAVAGFEGLRTVAYRDPVGIPTVCFGETRGVQMTDRYTPQQCLDMLGPRLLEFNDGVRKCVHTPMSPQREAALTSFAFNVGVGAFCSSTLVRRLNANDPGACDELLKWNKAKGIPLPGLTRRRQEERDLCLAG